MPRRLDSFNPTRCFPRNFLPDNDTQHPPSSRLASSPFLIRIYTHLSRRISGRNSLGRETRRLDVLSTLILRMLLDDRAAEDKWRDFGFCTSKLVASRVSPPEFWFENVYHVEAKGLGSSSVGKFCFSYYVCFSTRILILNGRYTFKKRILSLRRPLESLISLFPGWIFSRNLISVRMKFIYVNAWKFLDFRISPKILGKIRVWYEKFFHEYINPMCANIRLQGDGSIEIEKNWIFSTNNEVSYKILSIS